MDNELNSGSLEKVICGIVITAQSFNPSIFSETWLDKNEVIPADALRGDKLFSKEMAEFGTSDIQIQVISPRIQITFSLGDIADTLRPRKIATRIIELLPHTPYRSLGLNFDYFVAPPEDLGFNSFNHELLGKDGYKLAQELMSEEALFGRFFSKPYGEARLKLDIKPVRKQSDNKELFQFNFNFHHDLGDIELSDRSTKLIELINNWEDLQKYAQNLVEIGTQI